MADKPDNRPPLLLREAIFALVALVFGMFCLPGLIYVVGAQVIGDYEDGPGGFYLVLADALAAGNGFAWFLLLSPYMVLMLLRTVLKLRKQRRS